MTSGYKSEGILPFVPLWKIRRLSLTSIVEQLRKEKKLFYYKHDKCMKDFYTILEAVTIKIAQGNRVTLKHLGTLYPRYRFNFCDGKEKRRLIMSVSLKRGQTLKRTLKSFDQRINVFEGYKPIATGLFHKINKQGE